MPTGDAKVMESGAYKALALGKKGSARSEGVDYRSIHRWLVPVYKSAGGNSRERRESLSAGDIVAKKCESLEAAIDECCDPEIKAALQKNGRTRVKIVKGVTGQPEFERNINGFPIGYFYDFSVSNSQAIPVNVICHFSLADLTTFVFDGADAHSEYGYEFDLLSLISQVQGGGISLKPFLIYTRPQRSFTFLSRDSPHTRYHGLRAGRVQIAGRARRRVRPAENGTAGGP